MTTINVYHTAFGDLNINIIVNDLKEKGLNDAATLIIFMLADVQELMALKNRQLADELDKENWELGL